MKKITITKKTLDKKIKPCDECLKNKNHIKFINMYYLNETFSRIGYFCRASSNQL